jgi:hypothetical protein
MSAQALSPTRAATVSVLAAKVLILLIASSFQTDVGSSEKPA